MSHPAGSSPQLPSIDPKIGLMFATTDLLIPIFLTAAMGDASLARQMALVGIEDYQPATRADYVNLARTIAFSMASLALLGHAASPDMTMAEKIQTFGRANALNRSADQSERTMMQRRRRQEANPPQVRGIAPSPAETPTADIALNDAELEASIEDAMQEYMAACATARTAQPAAAPPSVPSRTAPTASAEAPVASPPTVGPHPTRKVEVFQPRPASQTRPASYKQHLLGTSAMPGTAATAGFQPPA